MKLGSFHLKSGAREAHDSAADTKLSGNEKVLSDKLKQFKKELDEANE